MTGIADRLDHVSIATWKISTLVPLVRDLLGARYLMGAEDTVQHFRWAQFQLPGGGVIELIEPTDDRGFLPRFLTEKGEGLHHITLRVRNIGERIKDVERAGLHPVRTNLSDPTWRETFIHPREAHGVLIQLAESELPYPQEVEYYQQVDWLSDIEPVNLR